MTKTEIIEAAVGAVILALCLVGFIFTRAKLKEDSDNKKLGKRKKLFFVGMILSGWFMIGLFMQVVFSKGLGGLHVEFEMFSERVHPFGIEGITLAKTTITATAATLLIIILLVLFRLICVPKFSVDKPEGIQNVMEIVVEAMEGMVRNATHGNYIQQLSPFMMTVGLFMIGCAFSELLGLRAPTSDLTCTLALGLCTFALLNIYGIKKNGIVGRLKNMGGSFAAMRPIMIPLKVISDIAVPVSLACRLFGNMLGGLLVMDLLKGVLGGYSSGLPAIAGLYFNLFHPGIQIYIFITLSLTFINEALELEEEPKKEKRRKKS